MKNSKMHFLKTCLTSHIRHLLQAPRILQVLQLPQPLTITTTSTDWLQIQPRSPLSPCLQTHHTHHTHHRYKTLTISKRKFQNSAFWCVQSVMCLTRGTLVMSKSGAPWCAVVRLDAPACATRSITTSQRTQTPRAMGL